MSVDRRPEPCPGSEGLFDAAAQPGGSGGQARLRAVVEAGDERLARAALSRLAEPDEDALPRRVAAEGPLALLANALWPRDDIGRKLSVRVRAAHPARDLAVVRRAGGDLLIPGDPQWPEGLADLGGRQPLCLWVQGPVPLAQACARSVAIVGARACSGYGQHVVSELAFGVAEAGMTVVSGGAYGIDAGAHAGALTGGGTTVAVLACGIDRPYPAGNAQLIERIRSTGVVVSELPPGSAPHRHRFLARNRLMAAMAAGTVVVEAALRSGALATARWARELKRPVGVVPGPVTSSMSAGCHALLRESPADVSLVTSAAEVVELVGRIGDDLAPEPERTVLARDDLSPAERCVLDALPVRRVAGLGSLAEVAGLPAARVQAVLGRLVLRGLAERRPGGWRLGPDGR